MTSFSFRQSLVLAVCVLAVTAHADAAPPPPRRTVMVPMSDGVKLATDVHLPAEEGAWPVILMRTPYNKDTTRPRTWLRDGYAVVVQDQRGRFASGGKNLPFFGCGWAPYRDGRDTLAWILDREWCDGNVGTMGGSALGITQNLLAGADPGPGLKAQYISVAAASLYHHACYVGGALRKSQIEVWVQGNRYDPTALALFRKHPSYDGFWKALDSTTRHQGMRAPAVHVGGWFDTFALGTVTSFMGRQHDGAEGARGRQVLVMGPWAHGGRGGGKVGELTFPNSKMPPAYGSRAWFGRHLKGERRDAPRPRPVAYYTMGESGKAGPGNEWRFADDWPIPCRNTPWYLHPDGALDRNAPMDAEGTVEYTFDPERPCPTTGGGNLVIPSGPRNQNRIEEREDVVTFTSEALEEPVEVTGHAKAIVHLESSAVDTDLSVRLCDVYPDGRSYLMAEGMLRVRYREGFAKPVLMKPGEVHEVAVQLWPVSLVFDAGHRIRLTVTSSNHPRFDVNPGTGKPFSEEANPIRQTNRIHVSRARPSHVVLPLIEKE